jgi:hypothetical protein
MNNFVAINVDSKILGNDVEEVFYAVDRIAKIEHGTHGGSVVTIASTTPIGEPEVVTSPDTPEVIVTKIYMVND